MYCQGCGKKIDDDAAFCPYCGKPTVNTGAFNNVISNGSENKKEKSLDNAKKIGIAVIIILIVIVVILAVRRSKSKVTDIDESAANKVTDTAGSTTEPSALNDIIGDWDNCLHTGSDTYANFYERVHYLRVETEGITAISGEDLEPGTYILYYAIGVDDITVQEENGIKYYTYSAEMYSSHEGRQRIQIRLYLDEETGWLVCELNTPGDGFWQKVGAYELMTISIEEDQERL